MHPIGDTHIGHKNSSPRDLAELLASIPKTPNHRILLMGDLVDCGTKDSIGASAYEQMINPNEQLNLITDLFASHKEQIDGAVMGNHEYRIFKGSGVDIMEQFCKQLSVPYLLYSGVVTYSNSIKSMTHFKRAYNINLFHGRAGGSIENALRACKTMSQKVTADAYLMGHCHHKAHTTRIMKYVDSRNGKIIDAKQSFVLTGQLLKYDDSYADQANLEIAEMGFPVLELATTGKKNIRVIE